MPDQIVGRSRRVRRNASGVQLGEEAARNRVLQGGARVFAHSGARLASVEDILDASGVSRRTFYRFFRSKDDVLLALYELGTEALLRACRSAVQGVRDPRARLERCVDAHLDNARRLPRLMFVLGGEAQHHESRLHARRMAVQDELAALLAHGSVDAPEALVVRGLIFALEGLVRLALQKGDEGRAVSVAALAAVRVAMQQLCAAVWPSAPDGHTSVPAGGYA